MATVSDVLFKQQLSGLILEQLGHSTRPHCEGDEHAALRLVREFMARQGTASGSVSTAALAHVMAAAAASRKRKTPLNPLRSCEPRGKILNASFMGRQED
jgi:hypothetical protein